MKILKLNPKKNKAQAIVEFALVLPILLLVVYGLIEAGRFIFIIASVNNATRQAARYGSTSGVGPNGVPRYQDCSGIRAAAQSGDFLNAFEDADITIEYDRPTTANADPAAYDTCSGTVDTSVNALTGDRVNVRIAYDYNAIVPRIVPFLSRTMTAISSRTLLLTINVLPPGEPTTTTIVSHNPNPSQIGQNVTVTVNVTGTSTTPTGTVAISGADQNCTITLSGGTGSCTVRFDTAGTKSISASYGGDTDHQGSSAAVSHTVNRYPTLTTITADTPDPTQIDQTVNVIVSVTSAFGTPTGTVTITGADTGCTIDLAGGTGNCNVNFAARGRKTLTASYSGDAQFEVSSDTERHDVILPTESVTIIQSHSPDPSEVGRSVTVFVTVGGITVPSGTVEITGADTNCSFTLVNGAGSCVVTFTSIGARTLNAAYSGDADQQPSSDSVGHTVAPAATTTTITAVSPNPATTGVPVSITVTVTGGTSTPTGTVNITGANTNCTVTLTNGTGSCNVTFATSGTKTLSAAYTGDATHAASDDTETFPVTEPTIANCNTITAGLLQQTNGALTMTITNPLALPVKIGNVTLIWNHDKGHLTGDDKTLRLQSASLNGVVFWNGNEIGETKTIAPNPDMYVQPGTSTLTFVFHQTFDRWDNTETVTINFANPGCSTPLIQNQH